MQICVTSPAEEVAVGAVVSLLLAGLADGQHDILMEQVTAEADGTGCVALVGLPGGIYAVAAVHSDWAPAPVKHLTLRVGETARAQLRLSSGGIDISGYVRDREGGAIPTARVGLLSLERADGDVAIALPVIVDVKGAFKARVHPGRIELAVRAEGYQPYAEDLFVVAPMVREIRLFAAGRIAGRAVIHGTHAVVVGADVWMTRTDNQNRRFPSVIQTNADGRFEFRDVESGEFEVFVRSGELIGKS